MRGAARPDRRGPSIDNGVPPLVARTFALPIDTLFGSLASRRPVRFLPRWPTPFESGGGVPGDFGVVQGSLALTRVVGGLRA